MVRPLLPPRGAAAGVERDYSDPDVVRVGGDWAPSIRHHAGRFWIYWGDPDAGLFMTTAERAEGPWEPTHLVKPARGLIDACPLWDDDGTAREGMWIGAKVGVFARAPHGAATTGSALFDWFRVGPGTR